MNKLYNNARAYEDSDKEILIRYIKRNFKNKTLKDMSKDLGCSQSFISKLCIVTLKNEWKEIAKKRMTKVLKKKGNIPWNKRFFLHPELSESFAYILGATFGDGSIRKDRWVRLTTKDKDFAEEYARNGENSFGFKASWHIDKRSIYYVTFSSKDLENYININYPIGSRKWSVPDEIINSIDDIKFSFLRGFFDAEGHASLIQQRWKGKKFNRYHPVLVIDSVNENALKQIKALLESVQLTPTFYHYTNNHGISAWRVTLQKKDDCFKFFLKIGFSIQRKQNKLYEGLKSVGMINE